MQVIRKSLISEDKEIRQKSMRGEHASGFDIEKQELGAALDIGTTTVVLSVFCIPSGQLLGSRQQKNRQTQLGSDVVMRLMHCQNGKQEALQQMLIQQVEEMICDILRQADEKREIRQMTVVGNPCMCHIFAGQDTRGLAGSPFHPSYTGILRCSGESLGFESMASTEVVVLSGIDAHVGADAAAMAAVASQGREDRSWLAVDIGTNAEMVLSTPKGRVACSVPAGPAFEGMEISCGMRGEAGAIAGVRFAALSGNILLNVLAESAGGSMPVPKGICGSGLVDVIAQMLQSGILLPDGCLLRREEAEERGIPSWLSERLCEEGFVIYQAETHQGHDIILSRQDIRQFQLAKAAVQAGVEILLSSQGMPQNALDDFLIAGVFGGHISEKSARQTGLFPCMERGRVTVLGNAAGEGAARALLSEQFQQEMEQFAADTAHVELAQSEEFKTAFLEAMELREWSCAL